MAALVALIVTGIVAIPLFIQVRNIMKKADEAAKREEARKSAK